MIESRLLNLPAELKSHLFSFLSLKESGQVEITCTAFQAIIAAHPMWKNYTGKSYKEIKKVLQNLPKEVYSPYFLYWDKNAPLQKSLKQDSSIFRTLLLRFPLGAISSDIKNLLQLVINDQKNNFNKKDKDALLKRAIGDNKASIPKLIRIVKELGITLDVKSQSMLLDLLFQDLNEINLLQHNQSTCSHRGIPLLSTLNFVAIKAQDAIQCIKKCQALHFSFHTAQLNAISQTFLDMTEQNVAMALTFKNLSQYKDFYLELLYAMTTILKLLKTMGATITQTQLDRIAEQSLGLSDKPLLKEFVELEATINWSTLPAQFHDLSNALEDNETSHLSSSDTSESDVESNQSVFSFG